MKRFQIIITKNCKRNNEIVRMNGNSSVHTERILEGLKMRKSDGEMRTNAESSCGAVATTVSQAPEV